MTYFLTKALRNPPYFDGRKSVKCLLNETGEFIIPYDDFSLYEICRRVFYMLPHLRIATFNVNYYSKDLVRLTYKDNHFCLSLSSKIDKMCFCKNKLFIHTRSGNFLIFNLKTFKMMSDVYLGEIKNLKVFNGKYYYTIRNDLYRNQIKIHTHGSDISDYVVFSNDVIVICDSHGNLWMNDQIYCIKIVKIELSPTGVLAWWDGEHVRTNDQQCISTSGFFIEFEFDDRGGLVVFDDGKVSRSEIIFSGILKYNKEILLTRFCLYRNLEPLLEGNYFSVDHFCVSDSRNLVAFSEDKVLNIVKIG